MERGEKDVEAYKRYSVKFRAVTLAISGCLIVGIWLGFKHRADVRRQEYEQQIQLQEEESLRFDYIKTVEKTPEEEELERRYKEYSDSIQRANMPTYTIEDVHKMVRKYAPSYSWTYLWRLDKDNWIMEYNIESGNQELYYLQRFNPTTGKFRKPILVSIKTYYDLTEDPVFKRPKNMRCSYEEDNVWGTLTYYEDGEYIGKFNRNDMTSREYMIPSTTHGPLAKRIIKALKNAPPDWAEEGYESAEDWFYDNEEDLINYYYP